MAISLEIDENKSEIKLKFFQPFRKFTCVFRTFTHTRNSIYERIIQRLYRALRSPTRITFEKHSNQNGCQQSVCVRLKMC